MYVYLIKVTKGMARVAIAVLLETPVTPLYRHSRENP